MAVSEAQKRATEKWRAKNKDKVNYNKQLNAARSFVRNKATLNDLKELKEIITMRENILKLIKALNKKDMTIADLVLFDDSEQGSYMLPELDFEKVEELTGLDLRNEIEYDDFVKSEELIDKYIDNSGNRFSDNWYTYKYEFTFADGSKELAYSRENKE